MFVFVCGRFMLHVYSTRIAVNPRSGMKASSPFVLFDTHSWTSEKDDKLFFLSPVPWFTHTLPSRRRERHSTPRRWRCHLLCSTTASCPHLGFCTHRNTAAGMCECAAPLLLSLHSTSHNTASRQLTGALSVSMWKGERCVFVWATGTDFFFFPFHLYEMLLIRF